MNKKSDEKKWWFPWYAKDVLSDVDWQLMTPTARGGYIQLLTYQWLENDCTLPSDLDELRRLSGLSEAEWDDRNITAHLLPKFPVCASSDDLPDIDGRCANIKQYLSWKTQNKKSKNATKNASKAAMSRWHKPEPVDTKGDRGYADSNADAMQTQCETDASKSKNKIKNKSKNKINKQSQNNTNDQLNKAPESIRSIMGNIETPRDRLERLVDDYETWGLLYEWICNTGALVPIVFETLSIMEDSANPIQRQAKGMTELQNPGAFFIKQVKLNCKLIGVSIPSQRELEK